MTSKDALSRGWALLIYAEGSYSRVVLYDVDSLESFVERDLDDGTFSFKKLIKYHLKFIVSSVSFISRHRGDAWNASEVSSSISNVDGAGVLAYDIAIKLAGTMMPDRSDVSPTAQRVWSRYMDRDDVEHRRLDNASSPRTIPKIDDIARDQLHGEWEDQLPIDHAFKDRGISVDIGALMDNHTQCMSTIGAMLESSGIKFDRKYFEDEVLRRAATRSFNTSMEHQ